MGFFSNFPYTNFHELNLNWVLTEMKKLSDYIESYTAINKVSYAGVWDISKQYERWSIVTASSSSYLALEPVPAGVSIDNEKYWLHMSDIDPEIFALSERVTALSERVTALSERVTTLSNEGYSVKKYGAAGDGVTDDSDAIQRAANENYVLFFPEGKYLISKTINIRGGTFVYGVGRFSELLAAEGLNGDMLYAENAYNINIENMTFTANSNSNAIHLTSTSETSIINCKIVKAGKNAILFDGDPAILPRILYNVIRGDQNKPNLGCGICLEYGCSDHVITGNDIGWQENGIILSQSEGGIIDNNMVWQCTTAFDIYDSDRGRVTNCLADFSREYSFKFTNVDNVIVTNCICKDGSSSAAGAYPAFGLYGQCTSCIFDNNNAMGANYSYAFLVENAVNVDIKNVKTDFANNIIKNNGEFSREGLTGLLNVDSTSVEREGSMANINVVEGENVITLEDFLTKNLNCYGSAGTIVIPKIYTTFIVRNSAAGNLTISNGQHTKELNAGVHIVTATVNGIFSAVLS